MEKIEDKYYIDKVLSGETQAYASLVDRYKSMAFTLALRLLKNREDAEEAIQDAFLKAYRSLQDYQFQSSFSTWLYRIVYNTGISKLRTIKNKYEDISFDDLEDPVFVDQSNALDRLRAEDQKKYINAAISTLPEDESFIVTLYYINESSIDEIGKITGLSGSNIKIKLFRARKKLYLSLGKILKDEVNTLL
jgi:RNA polymerase sigma-70 factor (ECF subfamily)